MPSRGKGSNGDLTNSVTLGGQTVDVGVDRFQIGNSLLKVRIEGMSPYNPVAATFSEVVPLGTHCFILDVRSVGDELGTDRLPRTNTKGFKVKNIHER